MTPPQPQLCPHQLPGKGSPSGGGAAQPLSSGECPGGSSASPCSSAAPRLLANGGLCPVSSTQPPPPAPQSREVTHQCWAAGHGFLPATRGGAAGEDAATSAEFSHP